MILLCGLSIRVFGRPRYIFLELATGGDLFGYVCSGGSGPHSGRLSEEEGKDISFQLMKGLDYMHDLHISHRGLFILHTAL